MRYKGFSFPFIVHRWYGSPRVYLKLRKRKNHTLYFPRKLRNQPINHHEKLSEHLMGNMGVTPPKISSLSIDWAFDYHPINQSCPFFYGDEILFVSHKYIMVQWTNEYQVHSSHTLGSHTEQLKLCWDHY